MRVRAADTRRQSASVRNLRSSLSVLVLAVEVQDESVKDRKDVDVGTQCLPLR